VLRRYAASLPSTRFTWPGHLGFAVKALAVVKASAVVRVAVPSRERRRLSLHYIISDPRRETGSGNLYRVADGEREVTFRACRRSPANPPSSQFPGYFIVRGPQCALIDIYTSADSSPLKRQIPFGVPRSSCPAIP
jgi:hypothetical protein